MNEVVTLAVASHHVDQKNWQQAKDVLLTLKERSFRRDSLLQESEYQISRQKAGTLQPLVENGDPQPFEK